jgi:L-ascorbate metabolism protein UlaG (beta-lactamase superfamily)
MSTICKVFYLGHSAWLVKTHLRLLLFDYGDVPRKMPGGLSSGQLDWPELPDLPLYAFSSHRHADHYCARLHRQLGTRPRTTFVLGLDEMPDAAQMLAQPANTRPAWPRSHLAVDDLLITCSGSTDSGVSFLVESPECVIYHGGDLAVWDDQPWFFEAFCQEIDFLADRVRLTGRPPDLAFLAVSTSDGYQEAPLLQGLRYANLQLRPGRILPMHAHGFEELYESFAKGAQGGEWPPVLVAKRPGDSFLIDIGD